MSDNPSVFSRWSHRKRAVAAEAEAKAESEVAAEAVRKEKRTDLAEGNIKIAPENVDLTEEEQLERLGLPDPETLQKGDDFAAFLKDGVPEALKRRALRTLWRSNPVLANLDGLVDHGEDYTDAAMVPKTMTTLYQVGKGMLRPVVEPAEDVGDNEVPEVAQGTETNGITQEAEEPEEANDSAQDAQDDLKDAAEVDIKNAAKGTEIEQENTYSPRRMAFRQD